MSFLSLGFLCLDGKAWGEWAFNFRQIRGISSATTLPGCMGHDNLLNKCCVWIKSVLDKGLTAPTFESFETVGECLGRWTLQLETVVGLLRINYNHLEEHIELKWKSQQTHNQIVLMPFTPGNS